MYCDIEQAQYILHNDILYHADWQLPIDSNIDCQFIEIEEITENEYEILKATLETNAQIEIEEPENIQNDTVEEIQEEIELTVAFVKQSKIAEMNKECEKYITDGFDIELSDGKTHHFSMTIQDQLNIAALSVQIANGNDSIPYHADGELCQYYSNADMTAIVMGATIHKTYHTSYFNSLKNYIDSLRSIDKISKIEYGIEIPEKYQSDVLKDIYKEY